MRRARRRWWRSMRTPVPVTLAGGAGTTTSAALTDVKRMMRDHLGAGERRLAPAAASTSPIPSAPSWIRTVSSCSIGGGTMARTAFSCRARSKGGFDSSSARHWTRPFASSRPAWPARREVLDHEHIARQDRSRRPVHAPGREDRCREGGRSHGSGDCGAGPGRRCRGNAAPGALCAPDPARLGRSRTELARRIDVSLETALRVST